MIQTWIAKVNRAFGNCEFFSFTFQQIYQFSKAVSFNCDVCFSYSFSNLFTPTDRPGPQRKSQHMGVRFNAPTHHVSPAGPLGSMRQRSLADRKRAVDYMEPSDA